MARQWSDLVTIVDHPLVQDKLTILRSNSTPPAEFRQHMREMAWLLTYEATRDWPTRIEKIETPLEEMESPVLRGPPPALISILRAGNGLLPGVQEIIPSASVGFVGLYRDEETLNPVEYYHKVPAGLAQRQVLILDPMLATGHSSAAAVELLKNSGAKTIGLLCVLSAPEGLEYLAKTHPDVHIVTAAVDRQLNERGFILPGLGDAGDRLFDTVGVE